MHPIRRLAFRVLLQAVADARGGASFPNCQMETLRDWAKIAGIRETRLMRTLEWARAGRMPTLSPNSDSAYSNPYALDERVRQYLRAAAP